MARTFSKAARELGGFPRDHDPSVYGTGRIIRVAGVRYR